MVDKDSGDLQWSCYWNGVDIIEMIDVVEIVVYWDCWCC